MSGRLFGRAASPPEALALSRRIWNLRARSERGEDVNGVDNYVGSIANGFVWGPNGCGNRVKVTQQFGWSSLIAPTPAGCSSPDAIDAP